MRYLGLFLLWASALAAAQPAVKSRQAGAHPVMVEIGDVVLPHVVNGGGWSTSIVLVNLSTLPQKYYIDFWSNTGAAWQVPIAGPGRRDGMSGMLNPGQSVTIETDGSGPLEEGYATVLPDTLDIVARLGGFAVFRQRTAGRPDAEAVVPLTSLAERNFVLMYDNSNAFVTGIALANVDPDAPTTVTALIRDEQGSTLATETLTIQAGGHTSFTLPARFAATANRRGSILFTGSGHMLSALGLRFNPSGAFTSFHALTTLEMFRP
jgi:hypothetical protein